MVAPFRQLDQDRVKASRTLVILPQFRTHLPGSNAHRGIDLRVERIRAVKNLESNPIFLDRIRRTAKRIFDYEAEEPAESLGVPEGV